MKDEFRDIIRNWVGKNFGSQEMEDPSWDIEALAEELSRRFDELYHKRELAYIREDIKQVAEDKMGVTLTDKQLGAIAKKYFYSEAYMALDAENIRYFIEREVDHE